MVKPTTVQNRPKHQTPQKHAYNTKQPKNQNTTKGCKILIFSTDSKQ